MDGDRPGRRLVSVGFGTLTLSAAASPGLSVHLLYPPDQGSVRGVALLPTLLPAERSRGLHPEAGGAENHDGPWSPRSEP